MKYGDRVVEIEPLCSEGKMSKEQKIKEFNQYVEHVIREKGTCELPCDGGPKSVRIAIFEADCYKADDSIDGFVGWWDYDDSQITHAATPYEVYCDMP